MFSGECVLPSPRSFGEFCWNGLYSLTHRVARNTLYPKLQDHELVTKYPSVHGLTKNVFFLHHENRENGDGDESSSKYNTFEVAMVKDLVLYLLR
jgi:hypothetical protein